MDRYKGELLSDDTRRFLAQPKRMAIGGEWVEALGGGMLEVVDPASGQVFDRVPAGEATDIDRAVAAARRAFEQGDWPRMRPVDRERLLLRLAELVEAHAQELAEIEALDNGKPVTMARAVDVALVVDFLRYMAGWATKIEGSTMEVSVPLVRDREFFGYTRREPVGVVGAIIPWNFPLLMVAWKAGPALASGCTMVLKPAEETPLSALRFAELVQQAGYPAGVFNVVTGHGHSAGAALAAHKGVDKVAFTGSTEIGKLVGKAALDNMTRVSLELGGKSPVIIAADADIDVAAKRIAWTKLINSGQICIAPDYLLVEASVRNQLVAKIGEAIKHFRSQETGGMRIVNERHFARLTAALAATKGTVAIGGGSDPAALTIEPTVVVDPDPGEPLMTDEIFGPILPILTVANLDEAITFVNSRPKPLAAYLFTKTKAIRERVISQVPAGGMLVNHLLFQFSTAKLPFGGVGPSGIGAYHGRYGFEEFSHRKSVLTKPTRPDLGAMIYPPYTEKAWKLARRLF